MRLRTTFKMIFLKYCFLVVSISLLVIGRPIPKDIDNIDEEVLNVLKQEDKTTRALVTTTTPRPDVTEYLDMNKGKRLIFLHLGLCEEKINDFELNKGKRPIFLYFGWGYFSFFYSS